MKKHIALSYITLLAAPFICFVAIRMVKSSEIDKNCLSLKEDVYNSVNSGIAISKLDDLITCLENRKLTKGNTSIYFGVPKNEKVDLFYDKLKQSQQNLSSIKNDIEKQKIISQYLENTSNVKNTDTPDGISLFPNNGWYCIFGFVSFLFFILSLIAIFSYFGEP